MKRWQRVRGDYMVKSAMLTDGELLHLMLGSSPSKSNDFDERFYESFQRVQDASNRALFWTIGAAAFGVLAHFGVLKSASAAGLEISPVIFSHVALLALSFSCTAFCFSYSKQTLIQGWFLAKLRNGTPREKATALMMYPDTYWVFHFLPGAIGYPKHILGPRMGWGQVVYIVLIVAALIMFLIGSFSLWGVMALDVWRSSYESRFVSILVISLSSVVVLLGWAAPYYYDLPRKYRHIGMTNCLSKLEGEELESAHLKIFLAASRMGLVDTDKLK